MVIAIIALLLAILIPALNVVKETATAAVCLSNLDGLAMGWFVYAEDNDARLVGAGVGNPRDPSYCWVETPDPAVDCLEEKQRAIMAGAMFPYVEATDVYRCPSDRRYLKPPKTPIASNPYKIGGYRSYSIVGGVNGFGGNAAWWIYPHTKMNTIKSPGDKYIFVEEADGRGWNWGEWVVDPRPDSVSGYPNPPDGRWVDPLTIWHNGRSTLGYADGHAEKHVWRDKSTYVISETQDPYQDVDAADSGDDLRYLVRAYPFDRPYGW